MVCYTGPRLRIIRRFGELPGLTRKVPTKPNPPGQHGPKKQLRSSFSNYKIRLFEKQKLRYNYGLTERQLLRYVKEARRRKGSTGFLLLQLLEMRLDTIVFRLGLTPTIPSARQFVNHGHLLINGKRVNIPSFICEPGDQIQIQSKKSATDFVKNNLLSPRFSSLPNHLEFDSVNLTANIKNLVDRKDLIFRVNELLIVEYYSRIG
jgi:small subunit ribosomal protein S4